MANDALTDPAQCHHFFQQRIVRNLQFWQDNPAVQATDVTTLDQEREGLIRAITFALPLDEARPLTGELIATLSPYMERRGYWESWHPVLDQAVEAAHQAGDGAGAVQLSLLLARLLQRESRIEQAIARYRQTIRLARQVGDEESEARACSNLGYLFVEQGHWHRAEVLCCHALSIFERIDSDHGRAHTENHLGTLYIRQHRWEPARQHLERACNIWEAMGDNHGLMRGLINLSALCHGTQSSGEALSHLEKALHYAHRTGDEAEVATIYMNIGITYRLMGEPAQAERFAWQAEAIFRHFSNLVGLANTWDNLGLAYVDQRKWQKSKLHLDNALKAWRKLGNRYGETRTLAYLVEYELARGNRARAARQLSEVEHLIDRHGLNEQGYYWQTLIEKYRRRLAAEPVED